MSKRRAALLVVFGLCILIAGLLIVARSGDEQPSDATHNREAAGQIVSTHVPVFASAGDAARASDTDYDSAWTVDGEGWLAFDLSRLPADRRQSVVLAWYATPDDGLSVGPMQGICPVWAGRPYFSQYRIETNSGPGGADPPDDGWVEVVSESENLTLSAQHRVKLAGANWIRLSGSGPNGVSVNVDVADDSPPTADGWLFVGDSILSGYASHASLEGPTAEVVRSFTDLVSEATGGEHRPIAVNAGTSCAKTADVVTWIAPLLEDFPGQYVAIGFGTNDAWDGSGDPQDFHDNLLAIVDAVADSGKTPVVAKIPWPNNGGEWESGVEALNAVIDGIYQERPQVVEGPDLYALTEGRPELYRETGDVHANDAGLALMRRAWADTALRNVYAD